MSPLLFNEIVIAAIILFLLLLLYLLAKPLKAVFEHIQFPLMRMAGNPLLSPHELNEWETNAVFNPGAVVDDEGVIHLLYRAIGLDGLSKIGHAKSKDGREFIRSVGYPVYQMHATDEIDIDDTLKVYDPGIHVSGGGWGGCEDPRTVRINDRVYMSYVAFEGWHSMRIALTSIALKDLKEHKWKWKRPINISPEGEVHKNWVLFPEKIMGKYAILQSIVPKIEITYVDNLEYFAKPIKSTRSAGPQPGRADRWDNIIRGAGAPPIKTELGWLLLYHAIDKTEPDKYKLGAMILSSKDPTKVLYRSPAPILAPDAHYENDGKPGVVYASGAVVVGENLHVYYGGGDKYVCAAETKLDDLLNWLAEHGKIE